MPIAGMDIAPIDPAIDRALAGIGLAEKERAVYLALLSVGTAPASAISKRTQIVKSTVQFTCQQLVRKGFVRVARKQHLYLFSCEPPEKLLQAVERRKLVLEEQEHSLQAVLSRLEGMRNPLSVLPTEHFYEGRDGIIAAYREVLGDLQSGDEILTYLYPLDVRDDRFQLGATLTNFSRERVKKGVFSRIIALRSPQAEDCRRSDEAQLRQTRIVDDLPFDASPVEILIYRDKICSLTAERDVTFASIVRNASITELHRAIFELAWRAASPHAAARAAPGGSGGPASTPRTRKR